MRALLLLLSQWGNRAILRGIEACNTGNKEEPYTVTDNTCIYIPGGLRHGPFMWNRIDRPNLFLTVMLSGDYTRVMEGRKYRQVNGQYVPVDEEEDQEN